MGGRRLRRAEGLAPKQRPLRAGLPAKPRHFVILREGSSPKAKTLFPQLTEGRLREAANLS
jgi:hypothetical protein